MTTTQSRQEPRLLRAPQVERDFPGFRISWPYAGLPAALDVAASSILDWFDQPSTVEELVSDLVEGVGMERAQAEAVARSLVPTFVSAGQLIWQDAPTYPPELYDYPPTASP